MTKEDVAAMTWRGGAKVKFPSGEGWFYRNETVPRLQRLDRPKGLVTWFVDGREVGELDDALARLDRMPSLTHEEQAELAKIPSEWTALADLLPLWADEGRARIPIHLALIDKGALLVRHEDVSPGISRILWRRAP